MALTVTALSENMATALMKDVAVLEDDEDLLSVLLLNEVTGSTFVSHTPRLNLCAMNDDQVKSSFRFESAEIPTLAKCLQLADEMTFSDRTVASGTESLCILLRRLAYPNLLVELEPIFGRPASVISTIFNETVDYVYSQFGHLLQDLSQPWMDQNHLEIYANAISSQGAPLSKCIGFIDGTVRPVARPTYLQRECYNGHKRTHAIKFQSVVLPSGLIANLYGPVEGRRHDCALLNDINMLTKLEQLPTDNDGNRYYLYGDPAYPIRAQLINPFRGANITADQQRFNAEMSSVRVSVEWAFGKLLSNFAFVDFKKNMKMFLQPVAKLYIVAALLTNCHTCCYGGVVGEFFGLDPPTLEEYLKPVN